MRRRPILVASSGMRCRTELGHGSPGVATSTSGYRTQLLSGTPGTTSASSARMSDVGTMPSANASDGPSDGEYAVLPLSDADVHVWGPAVVGTRLCAR